MGLITEDGKPTELKKKTVDNGLLKEVVKLKNY